MVSGEWICWEPAEAGSILLCCLLPTSSSWWQMGSRLKPTDSGRSAGDCPPGVLWLDTALHQVSSMFDDQENARMSTDFRLESFKKLECVWFLNGGLRRAAALQGWAEGTGNFGPTRWPMGSVDFHSGSRSGFQFQAGGLPAISRGLSAAIPHSHQVKGRLIFWKR